MIYPSICVCSISPDPFERFSLNFTKMFLSLRRCKEPMTRPMTQLRKLKVKVTHQGHSFTIILMGKRERERERERDRERSVRRPGVMSWLFLTVRGLVCSLCYFLIILICCFGNVFKKLLKFSSNTTRC